MRKILLLMCALLGLGVSGAWAKTALEYTALTTGVDYVFTDNGGQWALSNAAKTNSISDVNRYRLVASGTEGQYIATAVADNSATWTSEQASAEKFTINKQDDNTRVRFVPVSLSDYYLNSQGNNATCPKWTNGTGDWSYWYVFDYAEALGCPELTADVSSPKYYRIKSYNRGGYLTSNGAGQGMTHVDFTDNAVWYFTAADGNTTGNALGGVIAHCFDGTKMTTSWTTAAEGGTIYILPNGVNNNGLSISKTSPISSWSCCDANNSNTGVGNWNPSSNDWQGTTWVIEPTIPSGYYYFKGMATDRHPYLYSNFVSKGENDTYHHDLPGSPSNGHIWKVTNNGTTLTATNGEGLPVTIGASTYETLTIGSAAVGPDFYFTEALNLTNWGDDTKLTTWAGYPDATDNHWTFEAADVSAGIYNVVVEGNADGYVTYNGQNAKNGGFFVAATITEGDLTAHDITNYSPSIDITGRTITITYTATFTYTLTDANGAIYSWSAVGTSGVAPTITGCADYSLSNEVWNEGSRTYTADIIFPFPVSSNAVDNYTFIGQFNNKNGYSSKDFLWHVNGANIFIYYCDWPTTEDSDHDNCKWAIIPSFSAGAFTFTIKNKSTGTYINSTSGNSHAAGAVTLSETATPMTYVATEGTSTCSNIHAWYLPSTSKYLSANSVSNAVNNTTSGCLGVFGSVHDGISVGFHTYADLISTYWTTNAIATKLDNADHYGYPSLTNDYTLALNGVKTAINGGSYTGNATNYNDLLTWYEGFLAADVVLPTAGFYRIKSSASGSKAPNKYLVGINSEHSSYTARAAYDGAAGSSTSSIWYYNGSKLVSYGNGGYYLVKDGSNNIGNASTVATGAAISFSKSVSTGVGAMNIKVDNARWLYAQSATKNAVTYYYTDSGTGTPTDKGYEFTVEAVETLPVTFAGQYASFYSPVDLEIPSGVKAYTGEVSGDWLVLTELDGTLPHETGVILELEVDFASATAEEKTKSFNILSTTTDGTSSLLGTVAAQAVTANTKYVLGKSGDKWGFYKFTGTTLGGFKAYMNIGGSGVKGYVFNFSDETGIKAVENGQLTMDDAAIYNLAGQRLGKLQKGVNIVNGMKVLVK